MKSYEEIMDIVETLDLTGSFPLCGGVGGVDPTGSGGEAVAPSSIAIHDNPLPRNSARPLLHPAATWLNTRGGGPKSYAATNTMVPVPRFDRGAARRNCFRSYRRRHYGAVLQRGSTHEGGTESRFGGTRSN